jgi:Ni/Co efflux regulator RcnB
MKKLLTGAAALLLAGGTFAGAVQAQPYGNYHYRSGHYDRGNHYGWRNDWRPGRRMDVGYWGRAERVDWRRHHLRRPPYGYEWRYIDGRYVLAAVATGLIASIIAGSNRY